VSDSACSLGDYYAERAYEYDEVYRKPERQADLARLKQLLPPLVADKRVLEIAAGTGYWTQVLAWAAASITWPGSRPSSPAWRRYASGAGL